jgi:folylpolyglutamate synthase
MLSLRAFRPATSLLQRHVVRYSSMSRDYNAAVAALNTLQSNFSIVDAIRKSGKGMNQNAIPEMIDWVKKTGYEV